MPNRKVGCSAGASASQHGANRFATFGTKVFMNGSRPKARSNASPAFTANWQKWPASLRAGKRVNSAGPRFRPAKDRSPVQLKHSQRLNSKEFGRVEWF